MQREGGKGFPEEEIVEGASIEVGVLREEIDERALDRARRICVVLAIANAHIFLLIDMTLWDEDLKSYEYDEDMKDREWVRETREWKFETNDDNAKEWMKILLSIFYWLENNITLILNNYDLYQINF